MPLPFYLPRRHRRKLLFPPGLLALAGLLWVGCGVVSQWQEKLSKKVVIQLTMPVHPSHYEKHIIRFELPDPNTVCRACSWSDAYFTGSTYVEKQEQTRVEKAINTIMTDSGYGRGVRIHFSSASRYRSLVFVLDRLERK